MDTEVKGQQLDMAFVVRQTVSTVMSASLNATLLGRPAVCCYHHSLCYTTEYTYRTDQTLVYIRVPISPAELSQLTGFEKCILIWAVH